MVYETKLKIKIATLWTFFPNYAYVSSFLQTKNLHENEIVQLLYNYKCYKIDQNHFRKPLQSSAKNVKNNYPKKTCSFLRAIQLVTSLNVQLLEHLHHFDKVNQTKLLETSF